MKRSSMILVAAVCMLCVNCAAEQENAQSGKVNRIIEDGELISQLRNEAVETLSIGSNSFVLDAYLWRDFMPVSPPDGKPMIALNWLVDNNSVKIPGNISLTKQYVINNELVWESDYEDEVRGPDLPEYKAEKISRGGPKWETGIHVDVISVIHDSETQKDHYIICKNVLINITW